jgi:hypothetical protein
MTYRAATATKSTWPARLTRRLRLGFAALLALAGLLGTLTGPTLVAALVAASQPPVPPSLIINEIQTTGCSADPCVEDAAKEFIELYNTQDTPLAISGWKVRYTTYSAITNTDLITLNGSITAHGYLLLGHIGYYPVADLFFGSEGSGSLAKTGGHVELIDSSGNSIDKVGWGNASKPQVKATPVIAAGKSADRLTNPDGTPTYNANNFVDFAIQPTPTPQGGDFTANVVPTEVTPTPTPPTPAPITPPTTPPPSIPPQVTTTVTCEGLVISELLPNPAGTDTGHEFIELHNPTDEVITLDGCKLQSSASSTKTYAFSQTSLQPNEYRSFSDTTTSVILPNSAGGTVWLLSSTAEIQAITYPANMDDDTVWALTDGVWNTSFSITPNAANVATPLKPCGAGEVRNVATNRCGTIVDTTSSTTSASNSTTSASTSAQTPCKEGQERNPATNRCRNITSASTAAQVVCKAGQERNPETNRCRNIVSATASTAKACPAGQERNTETNRCRKITAAGSSNGTSLDGVKDVASASPHQNKPYWLIAVIAIAAAIAYGIYEWRQEISSFMRKHLGRDKASSSAHAPQNT